MSNSDLSWFVRDEVREEVERLSPVIAKELRSENIDPESTEALDVFTKHLNIESYTSEEFEFALRLIIATTTLMSLQSRGLAIEVSPGQFELTPKGKLVSEALNKK